MTFSRFNFGGSKVFFSLFTTKNEREEKDLFPSGVRAATGNGILQLKEKGEEKALLNYMKIYRKTVSSGEMKACGVGEFPFEFPPCSSPPLPKLPLIILVSIHAEPVCAFIYFSVFPGGSDGKEPACNALDPGSIPGKGRSPGEGNGNPLQYSCLENPMDRGAWRTAVCGVTKSQTVQRTLGTLRK